MRSQAQPSSINFDEPPELRLTARSVSRGIAMGKVVCLHGQRRQFYKIRISPSQIERETRRFRAAVRLARKQLDKLGQNEFTKPYTNPAGIFDVHKLILEDSSMLHAVEENIRDEKVNAEWAAKTVIDGYVSKYKAIPDEHLRDRYIDLEDVAERIFTALGGGSRSVVRLEKNSVIVARELNPSTLIEMLQNTPMAVITEHGGWTSHTFILAREASLPAVTGIKNVLRRVSTGDTVIVDGYSGQVIINPTRATQDKFRTAVDQFAVEPPVRPKVESGPLKTLDGREITIRANVDLPGAFERAKRMGAKGIGLYRSEFLFNQFRGFPTEHEQVEAYQGIAALTGDDGVRIRTFDLSIDQISAHTDKQEKNPALGLRAIRLSLSFEKHFRTQIRAILRASCAHKIDIVLPMISDLGEIRAAKRLIAGEAKFLERRNIPHGEPKIGAMIETPSSVLVIKELVKEVDFICLGTNDLVQYVLAVDRDNETVADWFRSLHPAVIRAVRTVLKAAEERGIPAVVCGEMAGSVFYVPVLIGLGTTELSMNPNSIPKVRKVISGIAFEETLEIAVRLESSATADESEQLLNENVESKWLHLFPPDSRISG